MASLACLTLSGSTPIFDWYTQSRKFMRLLFSFDVDSLLSSTIENNRVSLANDLTSVCKARDKSLIQTRNKSGSKPGSCRTPALIFKGF